MTDLLQGFAGLVNVMSDAEHSCRVEHHHSPSTAQTVWELVYLGTWERRHGDMERSQTQGSRLAGCAAETDQRWEDEWLHADLALPQGPWALPREYTHITYTDTQLTHRHAAHTHT